MKPVFSKSDNVALNWVDWVFDHSTDYMEGKNEILDCCKKMYPSLDITNIVESSEHKHIKGWCPLGKTCTTLEAFKVRPYRYLFDYIIMLLCYLTDISLP